MYVDIQLHQVASGVTVAVAHFVLAEDQRLALDGAMRETFESKTEPLGGARTGHRLITPTLQREDRIAEIRERYRQAARGWIRDKLPGQFTSLGEQGPPVWDLILTANEQLFAGDRNRIAGWRSALGFGGPSPRWVSDALPGLSLIQPPFRDRSAPAATFCGVETELLEMLEGKHRGEDAGGLPSYLNAHMTDILALWTLSKSLGAYDRRFSTLRDDLAAPRGWLRSGSQLGRLRREVMPFSFDLETLRAASENRAALAMPIRYSDADFREVTQRKRDDSKESAERTLISVLQASISEQGPATATQARQVTEGLRVQGELVLASTNIRLQWFVAGLTLVVGLAGVVVASGGG
jgi:hypothetical protein